MHRRDLPQQGDTEKLSWGIGLFTESCELSAALLNGPILDTEAESDDSRGAVCVSVLRNDKAGEHTQCRLSDQRKLEWADLLQAVPQSLLTSQAEQFL